MIVDEIVFLIPLSDSSLLTYRNATDFCILILYPAMLLNSLITSSSFLVESLGFSMYGIMTSANSEFYFFLSNLDSFYLFIYLFFCLITVARPSNTMLNKSAGSGHPCIVPNRKGNSFSSSLLNMMLAVGLSYMVFIMNGC